MIGVLIMLMVVAAFVGWDRQSAVSASPDDRLVRVGAVLVIVGAVWSLLMWWLVVPVIVFAGGGALVVIGRHRVITAR